MMQPAPKTHRLTWKQRLALVILPTLCLFVAGEGAARLVFFLRSDYDVRYLIVPFGSGRSLVGDTYVHKPETSYLRLDPCTGRMIRFTSNAQGGRGANWKLERSPGTIRWVCIGDSSAYGVNSPDEATWPALLEQSLQTRYRTSAEVFNAGLPGHSMEDFIFFFENRLIPYRADRVLIYGAWNNTLMPKASQVSTNVRRLHTHSFLGRLVGSVYNRSMLYTYLLEKVYFLRISWGDRTLPDVGRFKRQLEKFIAIIREHETEPILVLQMVEPLQNRSLQAFLKELRTLDFKEASQVRATFLSAVEREESQQYDRVTWLRVYQTQLLLEITRRVGRRLGVRVLDPQEGFSRYTGSAPLFCDVVHLSDMGNRVLAEQVARQLIQS